LKIHRPCHIDFAKITAKLYLQIGKLPPKNGKNVNLTLLTCDHPATQHSAVQDIADKFNLLFVIFVKY